MYPSDDGDIPDAIIRAFVSKIVVHEDSFDWYMRFLPDGFPEILKVEGKRKTNATVSSLCILQDRLRSARASNRLIQ